jgi:outer membrane protein assembly factor BamB
VGDQGLLSRTIRPFTAAIFGLIAATTILPPSVPRAGAQTPRYELSANVTLDEVDSLVKGRLERAKALVENRRWDEAVETLRQCSDTSGDRVVAVAPGYYVRLRDYCHRRLACLPPEALAVYREQVDPQARRWLEEGLARDDDARLRALVDQFYCSSFTDEALLRLGESALARADYGAARGYWEQLVEMPPTAIADDEFTTLRNDPQLPADLAALIDRYYVKLAPRPNYELKNPKRLVDPDLMGLATALRERGISGARLAYPHPDVAPPDVFARLILTWIFDNSRVWAEKGLRDFAAAYPDARGRLGGREVNFVEALTSLLAESRGWSLDRRADDWTTFGGNPTRNGRASFAIGLGQVAWIYDKLAPVDGHELRPRRVADNPKAPLSFHPVVVDNQVFLHDGRTIHAISLETGEPLWTYDKIERTDGMGFNDRFAGTRPTIGVPRHTLTVHRRRLLARVGDPITSSSGDQPGRVAQSKIICLDLDREGYKVWDAVPPEDRAAFEGTPLADDERVYVAIRKGGVRPQIQVACYDLDSAAVGRLLWRRQICSAESPGQGQMDEITHTLLTLAGDTIYVNTNLGAVAALEKHSGAVRWVATYPRAVAHDYNQTTTHFYRDLNPCVYDRGTIYVAPSDSRHILAYESAGGRLLWATSQVDDVVHLLGVSGEHLLASGNSMSWIHVVPDGWVDHQWPQGSPKGRGRGVLAEGQILWPTPDSIFIFDSKPSGARDEIDLRPRAEAVRRAVEAARKSKGEDLDKPVPMLAGGNIVPAGKYVLIATGNALFALHRREVEDATAAADPKVSVTKPTTPPQP